MVTGSAPEPVLVTGMSPNPGRPRMVRGPVRRPRRGYQGGFPEPVTVEPRLSAFYNCGGMGKAIKVSDSVYRRLVDIASWEGVTIGNVVERLLEERSTEGRIGELERKVKGLEEARNRLAKRIGDASYLIRHGFGGNRIEVKCPLCRKWSYLTFDGERERWVCGRCREVPF